MCEFRAFVKKSKQIGEKVDDRNVACPVHMSEFKFWPLKGKHVVFHRFFLNWDLEEMVEVLNETILKKTFEF